MRCHYFTGTLKHLDLASNDLTGTILCQLLKLTDSVFLQGNNFHNSSKSAPAPLSRCKLSSVEKFDLVNDSKLCPVERNALSDFFDLAKGVEWTNGTNWLDECGSYCDWHGVTCDDTSHIKELNLTSNGLSGRLSESIGNLSYIKVLDLSDNDMKVIPFGSIVMISTTFASFCN